VGKLHGLPKVIVSDRDKVFTSILWKELMKSLGTHLHMSSAYHPETDGQIERVNQCLETYLRCFSQLQPTGWHKWLPLAQWWYNTTTHSTLKMTPFEALHGYKPPILPISWGSNQVATIDEYLSQRQWMNQTLKQELASARNRMKQYADKRRTERVFSVGDKVYLKIRPAQLKQISPRSSTKLSPKFYGLYEVLARVGQVAYRLRLLAKSLIHPVFHVSLLKPSPGHHMVSSNLPIAVPDNQQRT